MLFDKKMALKRSDRYQRGLKKIREVYGDTWNVNFLDDLSPEMNDYTIEFLYGNVYNTDKLDARSRLLLYQS